VSDTGPTQVVETSAIRRLLGLQDFRHLKAWEWVLVTALVGWLTLLFWRGLGLPDLDIGLAYKGGQLAWATGHPENLASWISTPFLASVMAVATRVMTAGETSVALTLLNYVLIAALLPAIWVPLSRRVSPLFWWLTITGAVVFAPLASTIFWRQFNLISLAVALMGFRLSARRPVVAGFLVALSIAVKPLILLLPIAMLWKRDTRKAGIWSVVWGVALLGVSQVFLAWRAHSLRVLLPIAAFEVLG
jgi:hypothetical protein